MRIMITGTARVNVDEPPGDPDDIMGYDYRDAKQDELKALDGHTYDDADFTDYLSQDLAKKLKDGAYMKFRHDKTLRELMVSVTYIAKEKLDKTEIDELRDYTQGQWSDGIGEGYEQTPACQTAEGYSVYISAWHQGQVAAIFRSDDEEEE